MANTSPPVPRQQQQQIRTDTGTFYFPINKNRGSWPVTEKGLCPVTGPNNGRSQPRIGLKHSATMPPPARSPTDGTTTSQQFMIISSAPESAPNGGSRIRDIIAQFRFSNIPGLGSLTMNFPIGLPPLVFPALGLGMPALQAPPFLPDIEIKSKHKKGAFGKKWKQMRAVLDTGCTAGNWVSLDTLVDLGIKEYLPLTEIENIGAQAAGGAVVQACGAVNLTWRGVPGRQVRNCSRNFKMRFLVIDSEPAPFQVLIGSESIWKYGILQAPIFMLQHQRNIVGLPRETEVKDDGDLSYEERRERNRKLREKIKQSKLDQRGALKDPQIPAKENSGAVDTTKQGAKSTHNNP